VVERVPLLLQPFHCNAGRQHRALILLESAHRHQQLFTGALDHVGQQDRSFRRLTQVEDLRPARGPVDQVDHVIQPRGQLVNVLPVERGDEAPVEAGDHLVGELIALVLQPLDGLYHEGSPVGRGLQQVFHHACGLDRPLGNGGEQVEEILVAGQESHVRLLELSRGGNAGRECNGSPPRGKAGYRV
jgi:hypothetical protein